MPQRDNGENDSLNIGYPRFDALHRQTKMAVHACYLDNDRWAKLARDRILTEEPDSAATPGELAVFIDRHIDAMVRSPEMRRLFAEMNRRQTEGLSRILQDDHFSAAEIYDLISHLNRASIREKAAAAESLFAQLPAIGGVHGLASDTLQRMVEEHGLREGKGREFLKALLDKGPGEARRPGKDERGPKRRG